MRIYVASKAKHATWWAALRSAGVPINSTWVDWPCNEPGADEPTSDQWSRHWQRCVTEAGDCDVLLFLDLPGENQCGALVELGAALASGRQAFIVSPNWWSVAQHPRCRVFASLADAVQAIVAMQAGEASRNS